MHPVNRLFIGSNPVPIKNTMPISILQTTLVSYNTLTKDNPNNILFVPTNDDKIAAFLVLENEYPQFLAKKCLENGSFFNGLCIDADTKGTDSVIVENKIDRIPSHNQDGHYIAVLKQLGQEELLERLRENLEDNKPIAQAFTTANPLGPSSSSSEHSRTDGSYSGIIVKGELSQKSEGQHMAGLESALKNTCNRAVFWQTLTKNTNTGLYRVEIADKIDGEGPMCGSSLATIANNTKFWSKFHEKLLDAVKKNPGLLSGPLNTGTQALASPQP